MAFLKHLKVVVASPNDVQEERDSLQEILEDINQQIAIFFGLYLDLVRYEDDAFPGFHKYGPQGLIDEILQIKDCDVFIGIFWKKFGTPTKYGTTGTEHEFKQAYEAWKNSEKPQIMIYFNEKEIPFIKTLDEIEQLKAIVLFKKNFPSEGLWWSYNGVNDFKKKIRDHIINYLMKEYKPKTYSSEREQTNILSNQEIEKLLENYKNILEKKVSKIRSFGDNSKHEPTNVFTELQIIEQYQRPSNEHRNEYEDLMDLEMRKKMNPFGIQYDKSDEKQDKAKKMIKLGDLLRSNKGIIIVGSSGSGKSTILHYLTFKTLQQNERFPIYLELKSIQRYNFQNVKHFEDMIFSEGVISPLRLEDTKQEHILKIFKDKLSNGQIIFFLDGLDEIDEISETTISIRDMFDEFMQYSIHQNNQVIVTTRPYAWKNRSASYPVQEIEILPFNMKQIKQVVDYYYHDNPDATKFLDEISTSYELQEITKNPLILSFIIEIYFKDKKLSKNKLDLYGQIINNLYDGEPYQRREFLNQLAFDSLFNFKKNFVNRLVFTSDELFREVNIYCERLGLHKNAAYNFFDGIRRSNLLRQIGEEKYSFIHLIIQEYLAAKVLVNDKNLVKLFCQAYIDPKICEKEVLPMTLGFTSNKENLYKILEKLPESLNIDNLCIRVRGLRYETKVNEKYLSSMTNRLIEFATNSNIDQASYKEIILRAFSGLSEENRKYISRQLLELLNKYNHQSETSFSINNVIDTLGQLHDEEAVPELIALLKDEDSGVRQSAAYALGQLQNKEAVPELIALLKDEDSGVRQSAAYALGQLHDEEVVPELIALLKDEDSGVRQSAAYALGQLQNKEVVPELIALLKDEDSGVRQSAAYALGQLHDEEAVPELIALLKDEDSGVRQSAAYALGQLHDEEVVPELIALLKDEDSGVRQSAAYALGQLQNKEVVPELIALLKDEDSGVRQSAAYALGQLHDEEAVPELIALLKDEDSGVRQSAAYALGQLQNKEAVPELIALLKDEDSGVRQSAAYALGRLQNKEAVPELIALLKDEDSGVRQSAAYALGRLHDEEAVPELIALLKDNEYRVRQSAAYALGRLQNKEAVPELIALLKDNEYRVRQSAAYALGRLHDEEAVPELIALLKDNEYRVRQSAAYALGQLHDEEAVPELIALLKDNEYRVRQSAAYALGRLQNKEAVPELIALLKDEDYEVREDAANALRQYDLNILVSGLFLALSHKDEFVRKESILIIGYYSNEEAEKKLEEIINSNDQSEEIRNIAKRELEKLQFKMQMIS